MMNCTFYPPCTITGNEFNTAFLFFCQPFEKSLKNLFSKAFVNPYNRVGIVIDNDSYVLVSLFVRGFINAYIDQMIKGICVLGKLLFNTAYDRSNGIPAYSQIFRNAFP